MTDSRNSGGGPASLPPRAVDGRGRTVLPGTESDLDRIIGAGPSEKLPRRYTAALIAIVVAAAVAVGAGLAAAPDRTETSSGPVQADRAARELAEYAEAVNSRTAEFPPDRAGRIAASGQDRTTMRVTSRGFDGTCWQVVAYMTEGPDGPELDRMETVPYEVDPIHCRFNS